MAAAQDIKLDDDGDLFIDPVTGDFKIDFSDEQHIKDIIQSFAGEWKEFPSVGVGIAQYLNSSGMEQEIAKQINLQLSADGYSVSGPSVEFTPDGLAINPNAVRN